MQKTDLSYLYNCQIHGVLLLELFKTADFFKKYLEYLGNRSRYFKNSKKFWVRGVIRFKMM